MSKLKVGDKLIVVFMDKALDVVTVQQGDTEKGEEFTISSKRMNDGKPLSFSSDIDYPTKSTKIKPVISVESEYLNQNNGLLMSFDLFLYTPETCNDFIYSLKVMNTKKVRREEIYLSFVLLLKILKLLKDYAKHF